MTRTCLLLISTLVLGCGGGGGGSGAASTAPALLGAAWIGSGGSPASGDLLELYFSVDVGVVAGKLLDGNDLALSGGTLGTVTAAPTLVNARVVRLTLGPGVTFTAGVTTVDVRAGNDCVQGASGKLASAGTPRVITQADGVRPTILRLTLDAVDSVLNGTGSAGGTLQVPRSLFTIDVTHADSVAIDQTRTALSASVPVLVNGGTRAAGEELSDALTRTSNASASSFLVPDTVVFPDGACTITAYVVDTSGLVSSAATFAFTVKGIFDQIRPLESGQTWFLDFSRDIESYSVNLAASQPVVVTPGANSRPDFDDLMLVIGLHSTTPLANVSGAKNSNEVVLDLYKARLLVELALLHGGVSVAYTLTSPGAFPSGTGSVPYASLGFSQICIAGAEAAAGDSGVLGVAIFDPHNENQNNDCLTDFGGTQRLGVFLHTIVSVGIKDSAGSTFRQTYDTFTPARGGTPVGNETVLDGARLTFLLGGAGTNDARTTAIGNAITRMARFTAVVAAHEMGHSLGLVKDGAMPDGLYGGDNVNFPGSTSGHLRMPFTVFPPGTISVMSPSISFDTALAAGTSFNTLDLAYLRERALYN